MAKNHDVVKRWRPAFERIAEYRNAARLRWNGGAPHQSDQQSKGNTIHRGHYKQFTRALGGCCHGKSSTPISRAATVPGRFDRPAYEALHPAQTAQPARG